MRTHSPRSIETIIVVVPVQDEEALLPRCLDALDAAVHHLSDRTSRMGRTLEIAVTLVLDSCDDGSAEIARRSPFEVLSINAGNVGVARSAGIDAALAGIAPSDLGQVWIANTDADSAVPVNWLSSQAALAASGVELMIGTVRPDPADLDPARRAAWSASHVPGEANGHVHGANLGMRADVYRSAGGFEPVAEHEDVRLVERIRANGARVRATDECWVLTSGRAAGRTPGGYARYIREDLSGARS